MSHSLLAQMLFLGPVVLGGVLDLLTFRIPNWLTATAALTFPLAALAGATGEPGWIGHLAAGAAGLALGLVAFARRWIGGGDAKLFAAVTLWAGPQQFLPLLVLTGAAGGALTLALLLGRRAMPGMPLAAMAPGAPIPYGVAIAAAAGGLAMLRWPPIV